MRSIKLIILIIAIEIIPNFVAAQACVYAAGNNNCNSPASSTHDPAFKKVLYIDDFLRFVNDDPGQGVKYALSTLGCDATYDGVYEKEDELLNYAFANGFNSLVLYDMNHVFDNATTQYYDGTNTMPTTYEENLRRFIIKAKTGGYGITEVCGVVGDFQYPSEFHYFNGQLDQYPCTLSSGTIDSVDYPHKIKWSSFDYLGECIDLVKRIHNYNTATAKLKIGKEDTSTERTIPCYPDAIIDRMVTEYEFWVSPFHGNTKTELRVFFFQNSWIRLLIRITKFA